MTVIDQRIVSMQFENRQFEDGVQTTLSSLDKLKQGLNLEKSAQSLAELENVGKNFSLDGISNSIDSIADKFSALSIIGITAMMNIVNSAIDAGAAMTKSFTIDPLVQGFQKYEDKTTAVQTIMNATGLSIGDVNTQLDKLLWFTDETSYNFVDMVANIGKFTSQGIKLETSVTAMQGIANWAAVSGQNATTASGAMYNLAQAIGLGKVTGRDWMSIQNSNMATKEFKDTVIATAKAMGVLGKKSQILKGEGKGLVVTAENFSSTLSTGWFSSNVLLKTLDKYGNYTNAVYEKVQETGMSAAEAMEVVSDKGMELGKKGLKAAQVAKTFTDAINATRDAVSSGWMRTWEILFGNIEEAMVLWTDFTGVLWDVFASGAEARNELLGMWKELGGRDMLLEGISAGWEAILEVIKPVREAFRDIFPPQTAEGLLAITSSFKELMSKFKIGEETSEKLRRTFRGLFAAIDIGLIVIDALRKSFARAVKYWFPGFGDGVLDITAPIGDFVVEIRNALKASDWFNNMFMKIEKFVKPAADALKLFAGNIIKVVAAYLEWITLQDTIDKFKDFFKPLTDALSGLGEFLAPTLENVKTFVGDIISAVNEFGNAHLPGLDKFKEDVGKAFKPFENIATFLRDLFDNVKILYEKIKPTITKVTDYLVKTFGTFADKSWTAIKNLDFKTFFDLLNDGVLLAILLGLRKFIIKITAIFDPKGDVMQSVVGVLDQVRDSLKTWQMTLRASVILTIANALLQVAIATVMLSLIKPEALARALVGITWLFSNLMIMFAVIQKMVAAQGDKLEKLALVGGVLISLGFAILILSFAVQKLAKIDLPSLAKGVAGVIALVLGLATAVVIMGKSTNTKDLVAASFALILFSIALNGLANVVKVLGALDGETLFKGLTSLGIILFGLLEFFKYANVQGIAASSAISFVTLAISINLLVFAMKNLAGMDIQSLAIGMGSLYAILAILSLFIKSIDNTKIGGTALALNALAIALLLLTGVIAIFGLMPMDVLMQGLGALAFVLLALSAALAIAKGETVMLTALALGVMAGAIALLIPLISILGQMDLGQLIIGIGALALILGVLVGGLYLLSFASLAIDKVAVSFVLLGMGIGALGAGLLVLAAGLAALAAVGTAGFAGLAVMADLMVYVFDRMIDSMANGFIKFFNATSGKAGGMVSTILKLIVSKLPEIFGVVTAFLEYVKTEFPKWVAIGMMLILSIIEGIKAKISEITQAAVDVIINFVDGLASKLEEIVDSGIKFIIAFIEGLSKGVEKNSRQMTNAVIDLVVAIGAALLKNAFMILGYAVTFIQDSIDYFKEAVEDEWNKITGIGKEFINGIIKGIAGMGKALLEGAQEVIGNAVQGIKDFLGIRSPSKVGVEIGKFFDLGIIQGITKYGSGLGDSATEVGNTAVSAMKKALSRLDSVVNSDMELVPTITPVIDLTNVSKGIKEIDDSFGSKKTLQLDGNIKAAGLIAEQIKSKSGNEPTEAVATQNQSNIVFNQNNYSPKALSRIEIYRQTRNQLESLKGVVVGT